MSIDISASLNERQRSALLSYYLGQYIPASGNDDLMTLVQTPEDVYEYLLIDPLVSNAVPTSRVAQAMSSIQQYINGITLNMEPGYQTQYLDQDSISDWKSGLSQYDVWAGEVELDTYPENYIDPTLRQSQTAYFKDLITGLNQNAINSDTAQQAVMDYLNKFEQVANLTIVSGYLDGTDQSQDMYYFLGKSTTSPVQYYWRSFDMKQNVDNVVATNAWSEWYPMNTVMNEDALQGIPRLAFFNNRLYLFWFERSTGGNNVITNPDNNSKVPDGSTYDIITAYSSYCDFSNNWSAPYTLMSVDEDDSYCAGLFTATYLNTVCMYNQTDNCMTISLYAGDEAILDDPTSFSDFSINIDYWFNLTRIQSDAGVISPITEYLFHYITNTPDGSAQKMVQTAYTLDSFVINSVVSSSGYDDFDTFVSLPSLTTRNFSLSYDKKIMY
jgi:hypothetical protein